MESYCFAATYSASRCVVGYHDRMSRRERHVRQDDILAPEVLVEAYGSGVFPMGEEESNAIHWFQPDPRAIIPLDAFHVPKRLERTLRRGDFDIAYNKAFSEVMTGCAEGRPAWITDRILRAYNRLHQLGYAHSVEVWREGELVGGLYGVQLGGAFMAESKFHRVRDASKIALVKLVERLRERGFSILEVQYLTEHLKQFGTVEIRLSRYLEMLEKARKKRCVFR